MIKHLLILFAATLIITGCQPDKVKLVWDTSGEAVGITTLTGFAISPVEAYAKVVESRRLSLKHIWHVYADDENYYIMDP